MGSVNCIAVNTKGGETFIKFSHNINLNDKKEEKL
jgi:hypothetical protein